MIDVIIACHLPSSKYLNFLNRALKSLERQTFKDFNVTLVMNGLYTDKDTIINNIFYSNSIKILHLEGRQSCAKARNFGIKNSSKKYIALLDTDDQYMPEKLEKQINFLESKNEYIVGTLSYNLLSNGLIVDAADKPGDYETPEQIKNGLKQKNVLTGASMMFNIDLFKKHNLYFEENFIPGTIWPKYNKQMWEDWDLWNRICESNINIYNIQERLYIWTLGTSVER